MIRKFFTDILPSNTSYKLIWTLKDKKSHWFQNVNELMQFVERSKGDTFFGTGVTDLQLPPNKRALATQIISINQFHLDIDIFNEHAHKSENLPKTIEEALEIAYKFLEPTWIVFSGHGIHPYYCFNETMIIDNFDFWTLFLKSWQRKHAEAFPQYTLDSTHDLSRVLRCPGTMNYKDPQNIIPCEIIKHNESAYYEKEEIEDAISFDFKDALAAESFSIKKERSPDANSDVDLPARRLTVSESKNYLDSRNIEFDDARSLETDVFLNVQGMEPEFFNEFKNDTGRKSASEYQLRLANIAVKCGLNDQQVIDLLIQHRRRNEYNMDMRRPDKYVNDILKARRVYNVESVVQKKTSGLTKDDLEDIRGYLFSRLRVQILTLWRYNKDPNMYFELELANHPDKIVHLGSMVDGIFNQRNFISSIAEKTLESVQQIDNKYWYPDIVQKLLKLVIDGKTSETSTYEGQVKVWAREYFINKDIEPDIESFLESSVFSMPFYHMDRVYFSFETMAQWIKTNKGQNIDPFHFCIAMAKTGFIQDSIKTKSGGVLQMWGTPLGYMKKIVED